MKRKSPTQTREYAKEQYEEFKKGAEVPFYSMPYLHLVETKGQEEADKILTYYMKGYLLNVPCVKNGLLILSYEKYLKNLNKPT